MDNCNSSDSSFIMEQHATASFVKQTSQDLLLRCEEGQAPSSPTLTIAKTITSDVIKKSLLSMERTSDKPTSPPVRDHLNGQNSGRTTRSVSVISLPVDVKSPCADVTSPPADDAPERQQVDEENQNLKKATDKMASSIKVASVSRIARYVLTSMTKLSVFAHVRCCSTWMIVPTNTDDNFDKHIFNANVNKQSMFKCKVLSTLYYLTEKSSDTVFMGLPVLCYGSH